MDGCRVTQTTIEDTRVLILENDSLRVSVLPDKGADIYEFVYKPKDLDVLWKSPWGIRTPGAGFATATDSQLAWMENYEGGWQEIFPSGGGPCVYKGAEMNFHGEASTLPWKFEVTNEGGPEATVSFSVNTRRTPFTVQRHMTLMRDDPRLHIYEKVTNWSEEEMDYMWGHHPAFGAPFLGEGVILDVPARWIESQNLEDDAARLPAGTRFDWPVARDKAGALLDLSVVPSRQARSADLAFLGGFEEGWYGITNPSLGLGFGLVWPEDIFPYLWFWQEFRGSAGWPWYGSNYVMALEPFTSYDASGLAGCVVNEMARKLGPGESVEVDLTAVCFEGKAGVERIERDGTVRVRGEGKGHM